MDALQPAIRWGKQITTFSRTDSLPGPGWCGRCLLAILSLHSRQRKLQQSMSRGSGLTSPSMSSVSSLILTPMAFRKACRASGSAHMLTLGLELPRQHAALPALMTEQETVSQQSNQSDAGGGDRQKQV